MATAQVYLSLNRSIFKDSCGLHLLFCLFQVDSVWSCDAALRGGQHIPQVPHHHQVLPKNVEQRQRDAHLYLSGRSDSGGPARLELDLRARHGHSVSGGAHHRLDFLTASSHGGSCANLTDKLLLRTVIRFFISPLCQYSSLIFFSFFLINLCQSLLCQTDFLLEGSGADLYFQQGMYFGTLK